MEETNRFASLKNIFVDKKFSAIRACSDTEIVMKTIPKQKVTVVQVSFGNCTFLAGTKSQIHTHENTLNSSLLLLTSNTKP